MPPEWLDMSVRALCIAVLFVLGAACGGVAGSGAAAPVAWPAVAQLAVARTASTPAPQASMDPCASAVPDLPDDLPTAFAYDLESEDLPGFARSPLAQPSAAPATAACTQPDSPPKSIHLITPAIPDVVNAAGTTGDVEVKIQLSWTGAIQSVRLFSDTLHNGPGFQDLMKATILALAASTYAPAIEACVPVGSELDFTMTYGFK